MTLVIDNIVPQSVVPPPPQAPKIGIEGLTLLELVKCCTAEPYPGLEGGWGGRVAAMVNSQLSFIMWVPGIKLRLGLAVSTLNALCHLSSPLSIIF